MNYPNVNTFRVAVVERRMNSALAGLVARTEEAEDIRLMELALASNCVLLSQEDARYYRLRRTPKL